MAHSFAPHIHGFNPLVGTASWSDKALLDCGKFYPATAKTPEARLRLYASQFNRTWRQSFGRNSGSACGLPGCVYRAHLNTESISV